MEHNVSRSLSSRGFRRTQDRGTLEGCFLVQQPTEHWRGREQMRMVDNSIWKKADYHLGLPQHWEVEGECEFKAS